MKLRSLAKKIQGVRFAGKANPDIRGISENSKAVKPGDLFVCVPGAKHDGRTYA